MFRVGIGRNLVAVNEGPIWPFLRTGGPFLDVLIQRALLLGVHIRARVFFGGAMI